MRNIFLLLLLVNVLAYAYQAWIIRPDDPVSPFHIEQAFPRLETVAISPAAPPAAPVPAAPGVFRCQRIGPLDAESDAARLAAQLRQRGAIVKTAAEEGRIWVGHWVQVAGQPDRAAAEKARDALVREGLRDAYIVPGADDNRISLGVFRSQQSADQTVAVARPLGYETLMEERFQPGTRYWLEVRLPADNPLKPGELQSGTGQILRTEAQECPPGDE